MVGSTKRRNIPVKRASLTTDKLGSFKFPFEEVYTIGEKINEGQFGVLCKAQHVLNTEETFAVKIINKNSGSQSDLDHVLYETELLRELRDIPGVIPLIDFYTDQHNSYIVQALAEGGDVFDQLALKETYTERDCKQLIKQLLSTIHQVHKCNIVHRDLKPENLLLKHASGNDQMYLCDFGEAKKLPKNIYEGLTTMVGTPEYLAPEILNGDPYREKVDAWSIGVIMFILLCGKLPFGNHDDSFLYENIQNADYEYDVDGDDTWDFISGGAKVLIDRLLTADPNKRWSPLEALEKSRWLTIGDGNKKIACGASSASINQSSSHLDTSQARIRKYIARRKLKAACNIVRTTIRWKNVLGKKKVDNTVEKTGIPKLKYMSGKKNVDKRLEKTGIPKYRFGEKDLYSPVGRSA